MREIMRESRWRDVKNLIYKVINRYNKHGIVDVTIVIFSKIYILIKVRALAFYYNHSKPKFGLNKTEDRIQKVIVSLTSYPARLSILHICIKSLLNQSYKPDKIILYLGDDTKEEQVRDNILALVPFGLEIAFRSDNLKPHKKYFYAMQEYPSDVIVTVDDDLIYDYDTIESLIESYKRYPKAVSARLVHKILTDSGGALVSYNNFDHMHQRETLPTMQLLAIGAGGVIYPPSCLPKEAFDIEQIKKLCLNADDIWLKFMQIKNMIPVVWVPTNRTQLNLSAIPKTQAFALNKSNCDERQNEIFISQMQEHYSIQLADYCRRQISYDTTNCSAKGKAK